MNDMLAILTVPVLLGFLFRAGCRLADGIFGDPRVNVGIPNNIEHVTINLIQSPKVSDE
jgi:hypothetical protein